MNIKATIISNFAKFLIGGDIFERIKGIVLRQDDKQLSGVEKRHAALEEIKIIGLSISTFFINLAIELAVTYLRTLAGESGKTSSSKTE